MTIENPNKSINGPSKSWKDTIGEALVIKASEEKAKLDQLVAYAESVGKEEFNVDKLMEYYYPNDLTDDETLIRKRVQSYRSDYYYSKAMTLEEWARDKELIEAQGDS